jgi:hypothetical protein
VADDPSILEDRGLLRAAARGPTPRSPPRRVGMQQRGPGPRTFIEHGTLLRGTWTCAACGRSIAAGQAIKVTITPSVARNRVEHDPSCQLERRRAKASSAGTWARPAGKTI